MLHACCYFPVIQQDRNETWMSRESFTFTQDHELSTIHYFRHVHVKCIVSSILIK